MLTRLSSREIDQSKPRRFYRFTTPTLKDCLLPRPKGYSAFDLPPSDETRMHDDLQENRHFAATN